MKRYLIFGLIFLMAGCKAIGAVKPLQPPIIQAEAVPTPKVTPKTKEPAVPEVNALTTAKPILCANQKEVFEHLMKIGEMPVAHWDDGDRGFPVILFMNTKTGGSSVVEVHGLKSGPFKDLVCFISTGTNSQLNAIFQKQRGVKTNLTIWRKP